jgi:tubulin epsilon
LALAEQAKYTTHFDESIGTFFRNLDKHGNRIIGYDQDIVSLRARGICVDMEEGVIDQIKKSPIGEFFDDHQFIVSNSGSGNNWGCGYHQYGSEYGNQILESIRREAEFCDSLQSILMIQSTGGGTGSGLGSWISEAIRDEFPEVWRFTAAVVPSPNDDVVTSPYNSILSLWKLSESSDCVLPLDNQSLYTIYKKILSVPPQLRLPLSTLIDNGDRLKGTKKNEAFNTMNNIVANLLLNLTR